MSVSSSFFSLPALLILRVYLIYTIYLQTRFLCWFQVFQCFLLCCVVLCLFGSCLLSAPGCSGEDHEGEDAQERREVVVLLARQKQQHQICKFAYSRNTSDLSYRGIWLRIKAFSLVEFCFWWRSVWLSRAGWENDKQVRNQHQETFYMFYSIWSFMKTLPVCKA